MKKLLIIAVSLLLILILLTVSGWWWLTATQPGANWLLNRAAGAAPSLEWERLEGNLREGLVLEGITLDEAGTAVDIERLELAVRIHLPPSPRVDVHWLRVFDTNLHLPPAEDPVPEPEPVTLPDLSSPIEIRVREFLVETLTVHLSDAEAEPVRVDRLALSASYFDRLQLDSLALTLPELEAGLSGHWGLDAPFGGELDFDARYRIQPDLEQRLMARIHGDLDALVIDIDAQGPATKSGRIELDKVLSEPAFQIELSGDLGNWPGLDVALEGLEVSGQGRLENWELELAGRAVGPDIPDNQWRFTLGGNLEEVEIRRGRVDVLDGHVDLGGQARLADGPQARLNVGLHELDLTSLYPDWPDQALLEGRFDLDATPERLVVNGLSISAPPSPMSLTGQASWVLDSDELDLDLRWNDLNWPPVLDDTEPLFGSESGSVRLTGLLSDWRLELEAVLRFLDQPETRVEASASGSQAGANIRRLALDAGTAGTLLASGAVAWDPEPAGELDLRLDEFDPAWFAPDFPGRLNAELTLVARSPSQLHIDLRRLDGVVRDQVVSGSGQLEIDDEAARGGQLSLQAGDNALTLSSDEGQVWLIGLQADALNQLLPELSGQLSAEGRIDLEPGEVRLEADLSEAGWGEITVHGAHLETAFDWKAERPGGQLRLSLDDLDLNPWERVDQLELNIDGDCLAHTARLNLAGSRGNVDLGARGALDSCALDDLSVWAGAIENLLIGDTAAGDWELNQPLELTVSADRIQASRGCLTDAGERHGRICLRALDLGLAESSRVEVGIEEVPMDLLLIPLDPVFSLTTPLSGELEAAWDVAEGLQRISGFLELGAGALKPLGTDDSLLDLESIRLDLLPEPDFLRITLDAALEGDSRLTGQAQLVDLNDLSSATLDARARLNLPDIGVFNRLVTELDDLGGRLTGEMQLSGALLGPSLDGQMRLDDGHLVHAPLGLRVEDLTLALDGTQEQASLSGHMRSGDGSLEISGDLELIENQWQLDTSIEGDRFQFADVSWLRLSASPTIRLQRSGEGLLTLDGDVQIDRLRAGMPPGAEQRVNASADVRVRGETEEDEIASELAEVLQGRLGLDLGDDARLSALGMQARLAGDLEMTWNRQSLEPRARGVIRIPEGSYRAYGQNLEIDDGEIVFTGHAIDNPSLNIEAVRDIFGDPQVETAGVRIRGNARDPRITLFTEPPTSEEKALAYVVTGADFDHASGQAAISLGFYLLPRLFVSYGIGLFEAGNVLSGRYELSQRWGVRVVSGERDTGVDLSYAVDR
ncbi:MAG: hypothetical protein EA419_06680 [Wenzhouxiangella sp.]|nr:MAG: hypothetical protein EA419_06680 [Wenzhouxiangella sp.]